MKQMLLLLLFFGVACGQFRRFGDSFEDDSKEILFRQPLNNANRFRDSDEIFFSGNNRRPTVTRFNRFDDSKEVFFGGSGRRSSFPSPTRFRDSDEKVFFGNTRRTPFRRFDDSKEIVSRDRQGNFFVDSAEDFLKRARARNRFDDSKEPFFGTNRNSFRSPTTFRSNSFRNTFNNRIKIDSVEDVFDDLFDDDLDDRLRAQNTLSRLQNNGFFRNSGSPQTSSITNFQTRIGTNRFNPPSQGTTARTFQSNLSNNKNGLNHFTIAQHSNKVPSSSATSNTRNTNFNTNRNTQTLGVPLRTTNVNNQRSTSFSQTPFTRNFNNNNNNNNNFNSNTNRRTGTNANSIRSSPFSAAKKKSFISPPGFNWPGGNGYYVSMSTGNSKPVTYFVKYDD